MRKHSSLSAAFTTLTCLIAASVVSCGSDDSSSDKESGTGGATATGTNTIVSSFGGGTVTGSGGQTSTIGTPGSNGGQTSTIGTPTNNGGQTSVIGTTTGSGGQTSVIGTTTSSGGKTSNIGGATSTGGSTAGTGGATTACAPLASQTCTVGESNCFSFFVASRARMFALAQKFNGNTKGWGGDFRYGTADGLTGADKLCTEIAQESLPGNCRTWRAFLSTSKVNAISRVGSGPWYDRLNRKIAGNLTELAATRPGGITNSTILNNLPNEDGTPHHNEEAGCTNLDSCADNHDVLTGSDSDGKVCTSSTCSGMGGMFGGMGGSSVTDYTCKDWTLGTSTSGIAPRVGHTWPTGGGGGSDDWISQPPKRVAHQVSISFRMARQRQPERVPSATGVATGQSTASRANN